MLFPWERWDVRWREHLVCFLLGHRASKMWRNPPPGERLCARCHRFYKLR